MAGKRFVLAAILILQSTLGFGTPPDFPCPQGVSGDSIIKNFPPEWKTEEFTFEELRLAAADKLKNGDFDQDKVQLLRGISAGEIQKSETSAYSAEFLTELVENSTAVARHRAAKQMLEVYGSEILSSPSTAGLTLVKLLINNENLQDLVQKKSLVEIALGVSRLPEDLRIQNAIQFALQLRRLTPRYRLYGLYPVLPRELVADFEDKLQGSDIAKVEKERNKAPNRELLTQLTHFELALILAIAFEDQFGIDSASEILQTLVFNTAEQLSPWTISIIYLLVPEADKLVFGGVKPVIAVPDVVDTTNTDPSQAVISQPASGVIPTQATTPQQVPSPTVIPMTVPAVITPQPPAVDTALTSIDTSTPPATVEGFVTYLEGIDQITVAEANYILGKLPESIEDAGGRDPLYDLRNGLRIFNGGFRESWTAAELRAMGVSGNIQIIDLIMRKLAIEDKAELEEFGFRLEQRFKKYWDAKTPQDIDNGDGPRFAYRNKGVGIPGSAQQAGLTVEALDTYFGAWFAALVNGSNIGTPFQRQIRILRSQDLSEEEFSVSVIQLLTFTKTLTQADWKAVLDLKIINTSGTVFMSDWREAYEPNKLFDPIAEALNALAKREFTTGQKLFEMKMSLNGAALIFALAKLAKQGELGGALSEAGVPLDNLAVSNEIRTLIDE